MINRIGCISLVLFWASCPVWGQRNPSPVPGCDYLLSGGAMELVIDGQLGARVTSYKLDGKEILGTNELHPKMFGSTLWLGPQGKWKGHEVIDEMAYTLVQRNAGEVILKSQKDSLNGVLVTKHFRLNVSDSSVVIRYHVTNISQTQQKVSPWEVTRVPSGGMAFFPKGGPKDVPTGHKGLPYVKIKDSLGIIWYPYDLSKNSRQKLFMNGREGWLAYAKDSTLFIKKFPVIDLSEAAPGEKNVEIYTNKEKTYLELENQGKYQLLDPLASLNYEVVWYARQLAPDMKIHPGNEALVDFVRKVLR